MRRLFLLFFVFIPTGCKTGSVGGLSLTFGSYERGLWFDQDMKKYQSGGFGMKLDIVADQMDERVNFPIQITSIYTCSRVHR